MFYLDPISNSNLPNDSNVQTVVNNYNEQVIIKINMKLNIIYLSSIFRKIMMTLPVIWKHLRFKSLC